MELESSPWVLASEPDPSATSDGAAMLVAGQTFCVTDRWGDIDPDRAHGLFVADTRALSLLRWSIDGRRVEPMTSVATGAHAMDHVGRTPPRSDGSRLLVVRRRELDDTAREHVELRNHSPHACEPVVTLQFGSDFADVFAVKEARVVPNGARVTEVRDGAVVVTWRHLAVERAVTLTFDPPPELHADRAVWHPHIPAHGQVELRWHARVDDTSDATAGTRDRSTAAGLRTGATTNAQAAQRWLAAAPELWSRHHDLERAVRRSLADLAALRLVDPTGARRAVVAAGAPWFMTLFGRDSLLTAYMALPADPTLALGVLDALAELQGDHVDDDAEEEPGRILHEVRFQGSTSFDLTSGRAYYGSVDATPLFVVLLAELARWGLPDDEVRRLLPHADRALGWIRGRLRNHPQGLLAYHRSSARGLAQQGWKDSWDGIRHLDGTVAEPPVALCEAQAYAYAAFTGRAGLAARLGDADAAAAHQQEADALASRFDAAFWMGPLQRYATAIDGDGRQAGTITSNLGHCLWSGIVPVPRAESIARLLRAPTMWTGWGLRTLDAGEVAYDPLSYHCGSVWPHDTALAAAGLARYGFEDDVARIAHGVLAAAGHADGRLPELFAGLDRADLAAPVAYPTSCAPQAWAAAAPLLLARLALGIEPVPGGLRHAARALPGFAGTVVRRLRWWGGTVDLRIDDDGRIAPIPEGDRRSAVRDRRAAPRPAQPVGRRDADDPSGAD